MISPPALAHHRRQRALLRRPSRGLRWASRIESWPPRAWLALQLAALLPAAPVLADRLAPLLGLPRGPLAVAWALLLATLCFGGRAPGWPARAPWLAAAGAATALVGLLVAGVSLTGPVRPATTAALAAALLGVVAAGCARRAFAPAPPATAPGLHARHRARGIVDAALKRLRRGALCKCGYGALLAASGLAAAWLA